MKNLKKALISAMVCFVAILLFSISAYAGVTVGTVTADILNVRSEANTTSEALAQITKDTQVTVNDNVDGWYNITIGEVTGWVKGQFVSVSYGDLKAFISGSNVNVRTGPGTDNDILTTVANEKVEVLSTSDNWSKVRFSSGVEGWVCSDYVSTGGTVISRGSLMGKQLVDYAQRFLGVGYVYGGSSSNGFDCSGFAKAVYANFGLDLFRVAADQATQGSYVSSSNLSVGDLVFFDTNGGGSYINHVGIYMGNGSFIHASSGAGSVTIDSIWSSFYSKSYMTARTFSR